jgi:hypothetical protein
VKLVTPFRAANILLVVFSVMHTAGDTLAQGALAQRQITYSTQEARRRQKTSQCALPVRFDQNWEQFRLEL